MPTRAKYAKMTKYKGGGEVAGPKKYKRKKSNSNSRPNLPEGVKFASRKLLEESGKSISDADRTRVSKMVGKNKGGAVKGYSGGGEVTRGTSKQTSGRRNSGTF